MKIEEVPETQDVTLEEPAPEKPKISYSDDAENLVPIFMKTDDGKKAVEEIAKKAVADYEADVEGCREYIERFNKDLKIFLSELPSKDFPFTNCANANVPIMFENLTRNSMRAELELFGDWSNVFGFVPLGPEDVSHKTLTEHSHWQFRNQIKDFIRQQSRGLLLFFMQGDTTCRSYYDPELKSNRHEYHTAEDFVVPYQRTSMMSDWSDVPRHTLVCHYYRHQLQAKKDIWYAVEEVIEKKPAWDDEPESKLEKGAGEVTGVKPSEEEALLEPGAAPYKLLHYEGWLELPEQENDRWCQAIVDPRTLHVLSLTIHEMVDPMEQARFERQQQELSDFQQSQQMFQTAQQQYPQKLQEHEQMSRQMMMAPMGPMGPMPGGPPQIPPPPPPPSPPAPPTWMKDPSNPMEGPTPPRRIPIRLFTHFVMVEPIVGNRGVGFGRMQADFNLAANVMFDQFIDQASVANCGGVLTAENVKFKGGWKLGPGAHNQLEGQSGNDIRQLVMPLQLPPANPQLMDGVHFMYQVGQSSMQAPSVLSGEPGKSGETFRGISTRVEQATKQLTVPTRKFALGFTQVVKNNALLNSMFLPDEEIIAIDDKVNGPKQLRIGRQMYAPGYNVEIRADLRFASLAQRVNEADELVQMLGQFQPLLMDMPYAFQVFKGALEARGKHNLIPFLGPEPKPPMTPFGTPPPMPGPPPGATGPQGPQKQNGAPKPLGIPGPNPQPEEPQ